MKLTSNIRVDRLLGCVLGVTLLGGALSACGGGSTDESSSGAPGVLTIGTPAGFVSLNPATDSFDAHAVVRPLFNMALTHLASDGSIEPALATDWRYVGSNNDVFEITLRKGVTFSNGEKLDAEAVKSWFEYFQNDSQSPYVSVMGEIKSIEVVDDLTVRLSLAGANPILPRVISDGGVWGNVLCPAFVKDPEAFVEETCGVGPYVLDSKSTVAESSYTLVPNKDFYDPSQALWSKVVLKVIPTPNGLLQAMQADQVDVALGDASTASQAEKNGINVITAPGGMVTIHLLDKAGQQVPALADTRVRQALNYAVNREAIAEALQGDYATPTSQMTSTDGIDPELTDYYTYDPEKAKELLAEAGFGDGFSFSVVAANQNGSQGTPVLEAVGRDLAEIGVDMKLVNSTNSSDYASKAFGGTYPAWQQTYGSQSMFIMYPQLLAGQSFGNNGDANPQMQAAYETGLTAEDPTASWQEISATSVTEAFMLPIFAYDTIFYVNDKVEGVELSTANTQPFVTDWTPAN